MTQYISKDTLAAEIKVRYGECLKRAKIIDAEYWNGKADAYRDMWVVLDTLEVKDPYEKCVQYSSIKDGIKAHAETYSFNIESELFNQLTKEQQALWRKEIEQAYISGGEAGVELARGPRYKENHEVKEVDLEKEFDNYIQQLEVWEIQEAPLTSMENIAKHFFELGLKAQKGEY